MQRRKKVGGIVDRRFGENNPRMTLEEKAVERFRKVKQHGNKRESMFDLEEEEGGSQLTHFGKSIAFDTPKGYDDTSDIRLSLYKSEQPYSEGTGRSAKRRRISEIEVSDKETSSHESQSNVEHPKSRREVLSEVIAKSKLQKHERQQAKEDDDDLRAKLDEGLPDLLAYIRQTPVQVPQPKVQEMPNGIMNPDRAALLNGKDRFQADREYDEQLLQMAFDQRSKPTERTMNEAEKADRETQRLKELEEERLRRMKGEQNPEEQEEQEQSDIEDYLGDMHGKQNGNKLFDMASSVNNIRQSTQLDVEDEDEFLVEDSLVASQSDVGGDDYLPTNGSDEYSRGFDHTMLIEGDIGTVGLGDHDLRHKRKGHDPGYTDECPQTHAELLKITLNASQSELPVLIQRIRALYQPQLNASNKKKLGVFSTVLVEHVAYLADQFPKPSLSVLEALIRHIHSLAKVFPEEVGDAFRARLKLIRETRATTPSAGDLIILTAIGAIFSTSDQFHQVVTPAMLYMGFYLNQKVPQTLGDLVVGTYLSTLFLEYQRLSKRYIPELVNYTVNCLSSLLPSKTPKSPNSWHQRKLPATFEVHGDPGATSRLLKFWDILHPTDASHIMNEELKLALVDSQVALSSAIAEIWTSKSALPEIFEPVATCLNYMASTCKPQLPDPLNVNLACRHISLRALLNHT